ncbi:MAG TPA: 3-deoxy-manno-octulosonate cytidylyltransferase [Phototrophicaceae bacterium]|nr:3-deoxy-manno-octulosonate cytidylyltransferase [Phototrophicaceae bacterium]
MNNEPYIIGIIPARMASSRFPGKPLRTIQGIPMVGHCYFRSKMSTRLDEVYVATCDQEIVDYIHSVGGKAVMTADTHQRASDRTAEALTHIERETGRKVDIVVMIQGDEPMLRPGMIDEAVAPLLTDDDSVQVVNLMAPQKDGEEHDDINEVKVVVDRFNNALYFSREAIPSRRKGGEDVTKLKQVCIIPFRRDFLLKFNELEPTPLEIAESVDMNRVLEHGYKVRMVPTQYHVYSVDTEYDRQRVEELMATDDLIGTYK